MTMLSVRVADADEAQRWADALGVDLSELLRDALHQHLVGLRAAGDEARWEASPSSAAELSLGQVADWGPDEDWTDWADAAR